MTTLFQALGGLGLFLFGMKIMSEGLQKVAGKKMREILGIAEKMKENHLHRLQKGTCAVDSGLIFVKILTAFERMGRFCYNISQAVAGLR